MKNLANYLDDFIEDDDFTFESNNKKIKKQDDMIDAIKANRKASREEEIELHGKPINHNNIFKNKKAYCRKDKHNKKVYD